MIKLLEMFRLIFIVKVVFYRHQIGPTGRGYGKCGISKHLLVRLAVSLFCIITFNLAFPPAFVIADVVVSFFLFLFTEISVQVHLLLCRLLSIQLYCQNPVLRD
jgi:hypothetical protein